MTSSSNEDQSERIERKFDYLCFHFRLRISLTSEQKLTFSNNVPRPKMMADQIWGFPKVENQHLGSVSYLLMEIGRVWMTRKSRMQKRRRRGQINTGPISSRYAKEFRKKFSSDFFIALGKEILFLSTFRPFSAPRCQFQGSHKTS